MRSASGNCRRSPSRPLPGPPAPGHPTGGGSRSRAAIHSMPGPEADRLRDPRIGRQGHAEPRMASPSSFIPRRPALSPRTVRALRQRQRPSIPRVAPKTAGSSTSPGALSNIGVSPRIAPVGSRRHSAATATGPAAAQNPVSAVKLKNGPTGLIRTGAARTSAMEAGAGRGAALLRSSPWSGRAMETRPSPESRALHSGARM